ncbi:hypothetical protein BKA56DRAFT_659446 [Ilyonectria sp. MPI-CAGE-AT-0026]|nr:hypothetical protein BKA56DRAFT_659446 [Ilyonectria sp. MPI-CAGE-AT-0026]
MSAFRAVQDSCLVYQVEGRSSFLLQCRHRVWGCYRSLLSSSLFLYNHHSACLVRTLRSFLPFPIAYHIKLLTAPAPATTHPSTCQHYQQRSNNNGNNSTSKSTSTSRSTSNTGSSSHKECPPNVLSCGRQFHSVNVRMPAGELAAHPRPETGL